MDALQQIREALNKKQNYQKWGRQLLENLAASRSTSMSAVFEERKKGLSAFSVPARCIELTVKDAVFEFSDRSMLTIPTTSVVF
ncbi:hypothetical protein V6259_12955 [Marinomonas sp. TI.3.20]|uniref:hypothetical protein n=1 Tax=Marinomonas sp. TI.3.20 TaxID=3121296 RepID=UPI00311E7902